MPSYSFHMTHKIPVELQRTLQANHQAKSAWDEITPLARNEWICWITSAKKIETQNRRLARTIQDLIAGKKRPCCWPGCPHR